MRIEITFKAGTQVRTPAVPAVMTVVSVCDANEALSPYWQEARYVVRWMHEGREVLASLGRSALRALETVDTVEAPPSGHWDRAGLVRCG